MSRPDPILAVLAAAAIFAAAPAVQAAAPAAPAATSPQPAPAWSETFVPATVGTYLGDKKPNVMVVGATAVSAAAAEALRAAMRASKSAGLVMDAQAIGATEGLDDRTIVDRAKSQPVGQIVIVRVFDGGPDEAPSAIVTFYRPTARSRRRSPATAGQAIASNGGVTASSGVSSEAVDAVEAISEDSAKTETKEVRRRSTARRRPSTTPKYLWFENWIGVSAQSGAVVATLVAAQAGQVRRRRPRQEALRDRRPRRPGQALPHPPRHPPRRRHRRVGRRHRDADRRRCSRCSAAPTRRRPTSASTTRSGWAARAPGGLSALTGSLAS
jgi:hypothetical protein